MIRLSDLKLRKFVFGLVFGCGVALGAHAQDTDDARVVLVMTDSAWDVAVIGACW